MTIKRRNIFLLLTILTFSLKLTAQDKTIDSLKAALKNALHDTTRIKLLSELSEQCEVEDILKYSEPCVKLCEKYLGSTTALSKTFYLKHLAGGLNNIGFVFDNYGDMSKALVYYKKSLELQEDIGDKDGMATTLNNIGFVYKNQGDISKALEYYYKSLQLREEIKDKQGVALSLNNIGVVYNHQGDISKALEYYHKSLEIKEALKDEKGVATTLSNIAGIYENQGDLNKSLEYYQKSLKIREQINDKGGIAGSLNNIGHIYSNYGYPASQFPKAHLQRAGLVKAIDYYQKSLQIFEGLNNKHGVSGTLNNIGVIYEKMENIPKALEYYNKSLKVAEKINQKDRIAFVSNSIASAFEQIGKVNEAHGFAVRSLKISRELGYPENINRASSTLKKIYQKQNKFKEALEMYELEIQMRDSINNAETKKASIKKQFQYQYEKKAAADSVKNAEEQKVKNALLTAQQAQLKQEKTQRLALYGGLVLVIVFLGFVFNRFKITQKQKAIIEQQKGLVDQAYEKLHEKNKEVMDSIHYARRIQRSLLTNEKYIAKELARLASERRA